MIPRQAIHGVSPAPTFAARGFTLTELAVVLVIVALLIGGMIIPLSTQQDIRNTADTQKLLAEVTEALVGFAASHSAADGKPYLPCPDTDGDGTENRLGNACANQEGELPWADLGVARQDAWNNRVRYRVTAAFSNNATGFALTTPGDLEVCSVNTCAAAEKVATVLPAVYFSLGKNGGTANAVAATSDLDEKENLDNDTSFVARIQSSAAYDDVVAWLSPNILFNRMIVSGRLP